MDAVVISAQWHAAQLGGKAKRLSKTVEDAHDLLRDAFPCPARRAQVGCFFWKAFKDEQLPPLGQPEQT